MRRLLRSRPRTWAPVSVVGVGVGDLNEEGVAVESLVPQHQHVRPQEMQQPASVARLALGGGTEHRTDQSPGAGLDQRHQLQRRIAMMRSPPQPGPVPLGIGDPQRTAAVERHHPVHTETHTWHRRPGQQPGQHLEQRLHRRAADPSAQVTQCLRRRTDHRHPGQTRGQLVPDQPVADLGEQTHRQQEVDPDPRRKITQPPLHRSRLRKDRVHELERHDRRQLSQMPRCEPAPGHRNRTGDGRQCGRHDTMRRQRSSSDTSCLGRLPVPTSSVFLRQKSFNWLA